MAFTEQEIKNFSTLERLVYELLQGGGTGGGTSTNDSIVAAINPSGGGPSIATMIAGMDDTDSIRTLHTDEFGNLYTQNVSGSFIDKAVSNGSTDGEGSSISSGSQGIILRGFNGSNFAPLIRTNASGNIINEPLVTKDRGASTPTTQRVTIATDDELVVIENDYVMMAPVSGGLSALNANIMYDGSNNNGIAMVDTKAWNISGSYQNRSYRSFSMSLYATAGISAGAIVFEGSDDTTTWTILSVFEDVQKTSVTSTVTIPANAYRKYYANINYRYIRCRISTAFVGGTVKTVTTLSPIQFENDNLPLPTGSNVIGNVRVTDGNNNAAIKAASTAPVATDTALVVALSPNSAQPNITLANAGFQKLTDGTNTAAVTSGATPPTNGTNALITIESPNVTFLKGTNITGAATATLNNNVLLATAGATSIDLLTPTSYLPSTNGNTYRSFTCQLVMGGTITGGAITFEGSNDNTNFTTIQVLDEAVHSSNYCTTATLSTNYHRFFKGACNWRYLRARISTALTGTTPTVTAYTTFSTENFTDKGIVNDVTTFYNTTASTITTGGTSQFMLGAGTTQARRGFIVCNNSASNLYLNYGNAASATAAIKVLLPNETWVSPNNIGGRAVAIFGATTGQQFTYLEY